MPMQEMKTSIQLAVLIPVFLVVGAVSAATFSTFFYTAYTVMTDVSDRMQENMITTMKTAILGHLTTHWLPLSASKLAWSLSDYTNNVLSDDATLALASMVNTFEELDYPATVSVAAARADGSIRVLTWERQGNGRTTWMHSSNLTDWNLNRYVSMGSPQPFKWQSGNFSVGDYFNALKQKYASSACLYSFTHLCPALCPIVVRPWVAG